MKLFGICVLATTASAGPNERMGDPKRVDRIVRQLMELISNHYDGAFADRSIDQAERLGGLLVESWEKKNEKCGWTDMNMDDMDDMNNDDEERANMENPCEGAHQLTRSLARFAKKFLLPCGSREGDEPKFANSMNKKAYKFGSKLMRKAKCEEMDCMARMDC